MSLMVNMNMREYYPCHVFAKKMATVALLVKAK